jgi:hypothetical protein
MHTIAARAEDRGAIFIEPSYDGAAQRSVQRAIQRSPSAKPPLVGPRTVVGLNENALAAAQWRIECFAITGG